MGDYLAIVACNTSDTVLVVDSYTILNPVLTNGVNQRNFLSNQYLTLNNKVGKLANFSHIVDIFAKRGSLNVQTYLLLPTYSAFFFD